MFVVEAINIPTRLIDLAAIAAVYTEYFVSFFAVMGFGMRNAYIRPIPHQKARRPKAGKAKVAIPRLLSFLKPFQHIRPLSIPSPWHKMRRVQGDAVGYTKRLLFLRRPHEGGK